MQQRDAGMQRLHSGERLRHVRSGVRQQGQLLREVRDRDLCVRVGNVSAVRRVQCQQLRRLLIND